MKGPELSGNSVSVEQVSEVKFVAGVAGSVSTRSISTECMVVVVVVVVVVRRMVAVLDAKFFVVCRENFLEGPVYLLTS